MVQESPIRYDVEPETDRPKKYFSFKNTKNQQEE